jgi:hypothetical protein
MTEIKIIQQGKNPDCSLCSTLNCAKLNNPDLDRAFTQDVAERLMAEYINKDPYSAFQWLKEVKKYNIKYIPLTFAEGKIRMKK